MDCTLCDHKQFKECLIFENEHFCLITSPNQIEEGSVLLFPQQHKSCFGDLDQSEITLLDEIIVCAVSTISEEYQPPVIFEYGNIGTAIEHAHLHIIPVKPGIDLYHHIKKDFQIWARIHSFFGLRAIRWRFNNYVFYQNAKGVMTAFIPVSSHIVGQKGYPVLLPKTSQSPDTTFPRIGPLYLQTTLAEAIGTPENANLQIINPELSRARQIYTHDRLKKYFIDTK